jgi:hypothetical protein
MKEKATPTIDISVEYGDALSTQADVLALKYANSLYGVDRAVIKALKNVFPDIEGRLPRPAGFYFTPSKDTIAAKHIIFIGVGPLREFGYREIRAFGRKALEALAGEMPHASHIALTIHGPGYGLDEREAFESEIAGLLDAINSRDFPSRLNRITIVEANAGRAKRLALLLDQLLPNGPNGFIGRAAIPLIEAQDRLRSVGYDSQSKPNVFVAMPFAEEMEDVFHYGIQGAVNAAGFLCERADLSTFTGNVMDWVKKRIVSASLVIADLSKANPNVYLEVGFAWGSDRPTVLIVNDLSHLEFDVKGQRCLVYKNIKNLEQLLHNELVGLKGSLQRNDATHVNGG